MLTIKPLKKYTASIRVPGAKSFTHRALVAAALAEGESRIINPLDSDDTRLTRQALEQLGVKITAHQQDLIVSGTGGRWQVPATPLYLGNSGTSMRLLTALCALVPGRCQLTGDARMQARPLGDLLNGLAQLGVVCRSLHQNDCPPVELHGGGIQGGRISLEAHRSSQYLSALLLIAPCSRKGITIEVIRGPVSRPYIDMTLAVMRDFGITFAREGYQHYHVPGSQTYQARAYTVEADASQAGYFWAIAAVSGGRITVTDLPPDSCQGDLKFTEVLKAMGCTVEIAADGITVSGRAAKGITVDMSGMPDLVPTLAVVAAFAQGTTEIQNVPHLKAKESDRLEAVVCELRKMGVQADCNADSMVIQGGQPRPAVIETWDDHRLAMSFAVAGLHVPGLVIKNETVVTKSFPGFWTTLEQLQ